MAHYPQLGQASCLSQDGVLKVARFVSLGLLALTSQLRTASLRSSRGQSRASTSPQRLGALQISQHGRCFHSSLSLIYRADVLCLEACQLCPTLGDCAPPADVTAVVHQYRAAHAFCSAYTRVSALNSLLLSVLTLPLTLSRPLPTFARRSLE